MAGYTTGQAGGGQLQQLVNTPTEYSGDVQELARSQRLAELLSAGKPVEGQMVSGRFVAPSWTQQLAGLAQAGLGAYYGDKAETQQSKLAEKLRQDKMMTQEGIMTAINAGDMKKALAIASTRPEYGKEFIAPLLGNVIPKAADPTKEMQNYNFAKTPEGGGFKGTFNDYEKYQANLKNPAPHAPQLVSTDQGMVNYNPNTGVATPAMMNGKPIMPPMDSGAKTDLRDISKQQSIVAGALNAVKTTPTAFGFKRGASGAILGESLSNRMESPAETEARSYVFNIVSKVIHDRAGASQTPSEIAKINRFLPNELDNADAIQRKLKGFQTFLADEAKGVRTPFPAQADNNIPPPADKPNRKVEKEGTVQDGPNKGKRAILYSDGTIEYK
jgi:hypothetical protein